MERQEEHQGVNGSNVRIKRGGVSLRADLEGDACADDTVDQDCLDSHYEVEDDDQYDHDGVDHDQDYDDDDKSYDRGGAAQQGRAPQGNLLFDSIESMGDTLLRVVAHGPAGQSCDATLNVKNPADVREVCAKLAHATGLPLSELEYHVADHLTEARKQPRRGQSSESGHFLSGVLRSAEFAAASFPQTWLVKQILVAGQPAIMGGKQKTLKTSLMIDLVLSLGSGEPFLNYFQVPEPARVLLLSGESGEATIQETARRICVAKQIQLKACDVHWGFDLPSLSSADDLQRLSDYIAQQAIKVVVIDPLYLCLVSTGLLGKVNPSSMFDTGPLLKMVSGACRETGATPILVHHARKSSQGQRRNERIELEDLAFSGFAEFARQWLLVNWRENYDPNSETSKLWLSVGGSAGQSSFWAVDVTQGHLGDNFQGRKWQVAILSTNEAEQQRAQVKAEEKKRRDEEKVLQARGAIMGILRRLYPRGETVKSLREQAGLTQPVATQAIDVLNRKGFIEPTHVVKARGRGEGPYEAWRLSDEGIIRRDEGESDDAIRVIRVLPDEERPLDATPPVVLDDLRTSPNRPLSDGRNGRTGRPV